MSTDTLHERVCAPFRRAARQVQMLRNDRAARDVPVGVLCGGLRALGMRDIGIAGVVGFYAWDDPTKTEVFYYKGGHSAALAPENLPGLAAYVMDGSPTEPADLPREPARPFFLLSRAAPYLGWLVVAGAVAGGTWFVRNGPWSSGCNAAALLAGPSSPSSPSTSSSRLGRGSPRCRGPDRCRRHRACRPCRRGGWWCRSCLGGRIGGRSRPSRC
jgi:hypothetical protein